MDLLSVYRVGCVLNLNTEIVEIKFYVYVVYTSKKFQLVNHRFERVIFNYKSRCLFCLMK